MPAIPSYRHVQTYGMLWIVLPLSAALVLAMGLMQGDRAGSTGLGVAVPLLALLLLGRLVIEIDGSTLRWRFGYLGWPAWQQPLAGITAVQRLQRAPGLGSGIRGPKADRLYNVTIGGPAVRLALADGRVVTLGTPEPERLAAFIEARLAR
jgi:hypothetical protein